MSTVIPIARKPGDPAFRSAPHNIEVEQALLGAILVNNEAYYRVSDFLQPAHFFEPIHQHVYNVMGSLVRAGKTATPITIKTFLPADADIAGLNPSQYMARLASSATTVISAADYGRAIYDLALRRALIDIGETAVNVAYDSPIELGPQQQIEDVERRLYELAETGRYDGGFQRFAQVLTLSIETAARAYERDGRISGLATGLRDLDQLMGGLQPSDLIVLAGRPGMGKSSLAVNIGYNIARAWQGQTRTDGHIDSVSGGIVGMFSLEMSAEQLATRIIADRAAIPSSRIRRGEIDAREFERLAEAAREMEAMPFYIDETGGMSIGQLAARARRIKRQKGLDLMVIDYIQLMVGSSRRANDNRVQEVTEITMQLKALAKELGIPILALSQLSREVEKRDDKRPQLSDLRESGSIEQDADVVLFIYREEYYLRNREPQPGSEQHFKWQTDMEAAHGKADVIIGKQRHGPTGTVRLNFDGEFTRFADLAHEDHLPR